MKNTLCLGFTDVKHSWGILLKSPWNQCYLTSSNSCALLVFSQDFSRNSKPARLNWKIGNFSQEERRWENICECVWQCLKCGSGMKSEAGCSEREKRWSFHQAHLALKKNWFQIGPLWSKKWVGPLPGISLEDSHLPLSQRSERARDQSLLHP